MDTIIDGHLESPEHYCYESAFLVSFDPVLVYYIQVVWEWKAILMVLEEIAAPYPPVLVPPIISKYSQGLGGGIASGSMVVIKCFRIKRIDRPRTPPPSRESKRRPCSDMARVMGVTEELWK